MPRSRDSGGCRLLVFPFVGRRASVDDDGFVEARLGQEGDEGERETGVRARNFEFDFAFHPPWALARPAGRICVRGARARLSAQDELAFDGLAVNRGRPSTCALFVEIAHCPSSPSWRRSATVLPAARPKTTGRPRIERDAPGQGRLGDGDQEGGGCHRNP